QAVLHEPGAHGPCEDLFDGRGRQPAEGPLVSGRHRLEPSLPAAEELPFGGEVSDVADGGELLLAQGDLEALRDLFGVDEELIEGVRVRERAVETLPASERRAVQGEVGFGDAGLDFHGLPPACAGAGSKQKRAPGANREPSTARRSLLRRATGGNMGACPLPVKSGGRPTTMPGTGARSLGELVR